MEFAMTRILAEQQAKELVKTGYFGDLKSNPVLQAIAANIMQNPPPNLPMLTDMYLQSLEAELRDDAERRQIEQDERLDPLDSENRRLRTMLRNLELQKDLSDTQRQMAKQQAEIQALMSLPNPATAALAQGQGMPPAEPPPMAQPGPATPEGMPPEGAPAPVAPQPPQGAGPIEAAAM